MKYQNEVLNAPVIELELSARGHNVLTVHAKPPVECIGDLVQMTERRLMHTVSCGRVTVNEIKSVLATMGLRLGMQVDVLEESVMSRADLAADPMLQFFQYAHLPEELQEISKEFGALALLLIDKLPRNPERAAALRKLLEAKDCAVRARLYR